MKARLGGLFLTFTALGVLVASGLLRPDPSGLGTHRQLGLLPCAFLQLTGIRCPSCGLTTSFAAIARADFALALRSNPLGLVLFAITVLLVPTGCWLAARRISLGALFYSRWFDRIGLALLLLWLATWSVRLLAAGPLLVGPR